MEKISLSKIECEEWLSELLSKYRKKNNLDTWKDTLHGFIRELLEKAEKPAEADISKSSDIVDTPHSPLPQQAQLPYDPKATPSEVIASVCKKDPAIRDWLRAYLNSYYAEAREQIHTDAILERKRQSAEFRKQALADRAEQTAFESRKRAEEREKHQRPRHVVIEQPNSGPAAYNREWD